MFTLKKIKLPQAVKVGGGFYKIKTDYRYFLILKDKLEQKEINEKEFDFMYNCTPPADRLEGIRALAEFMTPPQELPRRTKEQTKEEILNFDIDAPYIYAAFKEQYKIDLIDEPLHWYKFLALLHGLHDTELNRIIAARLWKPSGKNTEYEKAQQKLYEAWRLPQPEDNEPDEALEDFLGKLKG
jgi:hypothetical protein